MLRPTPTPTPNNPTTSIIPVAFSTNGPISGLAVNKSTTGFGNVFPVATPTPTPLPTIVSYTAVNMPIGTTYYYGAKSFTPTQAGITTLTNISSGASAIYDDRYVVCASTNPDLLRCGLANNPQGLKDNFQIASNQVPFDVVATDTATYSGTAANIKFDQVQAVDSNGNDVTSLLTFNPPLSTTAPKSLKLTVSGNLPAPTCVVFRVSTNSTTGTVLNRAVCSVSVGYVAPGAPVPDSRKWTLSVAFNQPKNGTQVSNLNAITVLSLTKITSNSIPTVEGSLSFFSSPVFPLRLTTPYITIRRPDGRYWSGAPLRTWVTTETRLPTLVSATAPSVTGEDISKIFPPCLYNLRPEDVPTPADLVPGAYTLATYDRAASSGRVAGALFLTDVTSSITVNVSGGSSGLSAQADRPKGSRWAAVLHRFSEGG